MDMEKNINRIFGYARISTEYENEAHQIKALTAAGVDDRFVFVDKASGKNFERAAYQILIRALREGDTLIINSVADSIVYR
jgi:DNA invertase Pin-like site-specific DNA recombinase